MKQCQTFLRIPLGGIQIIIEFIYHRIGTSSRDDNWKKIVKENIPGPGNYNLKLEQNNSIKFGTEKRDWKIKSDTPGPGQYYIPCSMVDVPRYTRGGSSFQEKWKFV